MEGATNIESVPRGDGYFYAATLDKNGATVTWDAKSNDEYTINADRLIIRQILLGHTANENEYNVVEVETISVEDPIKIPIAVLKVGETRLVQPLLEFPDGPVTFTLVEGNGPVYIHGLQAPSPYVSDEVVEEEEYIMDEEGLEEDDDVEENPTKKQKLQSNNAKSIGNNKASLSHKKK